jgi:transposase
MLSFSHTLKIYLAVAPTDMRKNHDSLAALVEHLLQENPLSGQLFVFRNKRADRIKLLYWDSSGFALWYKRLERGNFRFPVAAADATRIDIAPSDFMMLLDGVELSSVKRQKRFQLTPENISQNNSA